jgi:hypothetical protein
MPFFLTIRDICGGVAVTAGMGQENEPAFAGEVSVAVGAFSAAAVNG